MIQNWKDSFLGKPLTWVIVAALVIFGIWYAGKKAGESSVKDYDPKDLPNGGAEIPAGWEKNQAKALVDNWHRIYSEWFSWGSDITALYNQFLALTNDQLVYSNNLYNSRWGAKEKVSFYKTIDGKLIIASAERQKLMARLEILNIRS